MEELIDRLRGALAETGLERAVLSHPETLAHLCLFDPAVEEWPVANPFVASPALLVLDGRRGDAAGRELPRRARGAQPGARRAVPLVRLRARARTGGRAGGGAARPRGRPRPHRHRGLVAAGRGRRRPPSRGRRADRGGRARRAGAAHQAARSSSRRSGGRRDLSDLVQSAVKELAEPGVSEAEVAAQAQAVMASEAGRRVPAILTVTTGEATGDGRLGGHGTRDRRPATSCSATPRRGSTATGRTAPTPSAPGCRAASSAASSTACGGRSSSRSGSAGPARMACDVDAAVRAELADLGPTYGHHTGHGIGASWSEPPRITPYERIAARRGHGAGRRAGVLRRGLRRHPPRARVRRACRAETRSSPDSSTPCERRPRRAHRRQRPLPPPRGQLDRRARRRHRHPRAHHDRRRAGRLGRGDERRRRRLDRGRRAGHGALRRRARSLERQRDARGRVQLRALAVPGRRRGTSPGRASTWRSPTSAARPPASRSGACSAAPCATT